MNQCFVPIQQIQEYLGKELTGFQVKNNYYYCTKGDIYIYFLQSLLQRPRGQGREVKEQNSRVE